MTQQYKIKKRGIRTTVITGPVEIQKMVLSASMGFQSKCDS